ncbi:MAG TPA: lipopolysaccharide kinase InaA family protein [Flavobacterium sp.]|nr:lipopolysaccharide kinase InaA family protein [Flavobacterium sp.]
MKLTINPDFKQIENEIKEAMLHFEHKGTLLVKGSRNTIKTFETSAGIINVKSFKKPNFINTIVYRYLRASKAKRSFEYGLKLRSKEIGTPEPIAFSEFPNGMGLGKSFYVCKHIHAIHTFRDLVEQPFLKNHNLILRAFTRFCFELHENGVEFKDHSPGNTLIIAEEDTDYTFYLVDLNRMNFLKEMSFEQRMYNLRRLTPKKEMISVMANEYSKLYTKRTEKDIFQLMWQYTLDFQEHFKRKQKIKKRIKFWKK